MKKPITRIIAAALAAAMLLGTTSCIGSFSLTNRLLSWNKHVGNKFVNELVFFAFWVLPVYEVTGLADVLVLNSIEFWSGRNPVGDTASTRTVTNSQGHEVLIATDAQGYDLTDTVTGQTMRLSYNPAIDGWDLTANGQTMTIFTFVDDTHIRLPQRGTDAWTTVELSSRALSEYAAL